MSEEIEKPLTTPEFRERKKALLVGVYEGASEKESCLLHLDELGRLCDTYGLPYAEKIAVPLKKVDAGTYLGSGKVEELAKKAKELGVDMILLDNEISPKQQRNLEEAFQCAVSDRTELILEVFAKAAQTREARLQIQLAQMRYQFPRLKRLWTHLSRQKTGGGGGGHLKGEGEKQIEIDRRLVRMRIHRLEQEIEEVRAVRATKRQARIRSGIPTFAIVGYTNSGKSTLLKALTDAEVLVEDKLFATLDTKSRKFLLPNNQEILLVDTVGFIRKIPHTLVAAFRSTLEEAVFTDILLHLVDVSSPMALEQASETHKVLEELGAKHRPIITVLNKVDACTDPSIITKLCIKYAKTVQISALHKTGFDQLLKQMMEQIKELRTIVRLRVPQSDYAFIGELQRVGRILSQEYEENDVLLEAEVPREFAYKVEPYLIAPT